MDDFDAFQSLLHQGISLLPVRYRPGRVQVPTPFQSLLHQGISLLWAADHRREVEARLVSIPSSSGHQFTERMRRQLPAFNAVLVSIPSSSGHQFTGRRFEL